MMQDLVVEDMEPKTESQEIAEGAPTFGLPDGLTVEIEGELYVLKDGKLEAVDDENKVTPTMAAFLKNLSRAQKMPWFFSQGVRISKHRASHVPLDVRAQRSHKKSKAAKQARKANRP
jgi:hypothetical protein